MTTEIAPGIVVDPKVKVGKPIIKGTRVPVELVIGKLAGGMTQEEVMAEYRLSRDEVLAALRYAAHIISLEEVRALD